MNPPRCEPGPTSPRSSPSPSFRERFPLYVRALAISSRPLARVGSRLVWRVHGATVKAFVASFGSSWEMGRDVVNEDTMALLSGKVAIITGGGRGIGRAVALRLAAEGARVVVDDVGVEGDGTGGSPEPANEVVREITQAGGTAVACYENAATTEGAERIVAAAIDAFGQVDVLVTSAGITRDKTLLKMDLASWESVLGAHLTGTFACIQAVARRMIAQGRGGRIVTMTGHSGMWGSFGLVSDSAASAGVYGLTRTAAIELQKHRIQVNAIAPIARTRLTEALPMMQGVEGLSPEHVAPAAVFLASDLCGDRTGQVLAVAGARMYVYKVIETTGRFKEPEDGVWTPEEIAEHFLTLTKP